MSTFSALDSSQIPAPNDPTPNIVLKEKGSRQLCFGFLEAEEMLELCLPWNIENLLLNESPASKTPKRDWTNQSINQLQPLAWEGLKQPTRPIITSVDETTAEQLWHTKGKVPFFVFGQGLSLLRYKTNVALQLVEKKLFEANFLRKTE